MGYRRRKTRRFHIVLLIEKEIKKKKKIEEPGFQMNKFKLKKGLSGSRRMRGKGKRFLVLLIIRRS